MRLQIKFRFTLCLALLFSARAALVNVTVDDSGSDPLTGRTILYSPVGGWKTGDHCNGCSAHPDPRQVQGGTWHDGTFNSQRGSNDVPNQPLLAKFSFSGTAVYVLCALARTTNLPAGNSDMTFYINGTVMNNFSKPAPGTEGYDYNVTVFSAPSLPHGLHDLAIQNGHIDGPKSLMLLDAIVYTFDDGSQDSKMSSPTPVGAIVGGTIGGLAFLIATILGFLWWRKRKSEHGTIVQPLVLVQTQVVEPTPTARSPSRHGQGSSLALPMTAPTGSLSVSNVPERDYADEPPAYELDDVESSSRSGSRSNYPTPPRRAVKRR